MNKRHFAWIFASMPLVFSGCGEEDKPGFGVAPVNPNRQPAPRYSQSALSIPGIINEAFHAASAGWATASLGVTYLWSFDDLGVFPLYSSLALPTEELVVAVIDTGVDRGHEDLQGRLWVNPVESLGSQYSNAADDDGNGYADDHLGWDFANDTNNPADDNGHGTHVAGTIGAIGGNARGIVGVAPWVRIMALKVCNMNGSCSSSDIRAAMAYAVAHGAKIINLSLGALNTGADARAFEQAVTEATEAGVLVVTAAGNYATRTELMTPANATHSVAVAAHRNDGEICSFSNYGWRVDLSAPGCGYDGQSEVAGVLSLNSRNCGDTGDRLCAIRRSVSGDYALKSGTSMSAPHIAGLAAVAWTASPEATPLQIRQALSRTARKSRTGNAHFDFGMGRAHGTNLIDEARTAPGLRILSPRYGAADVSHSIAFRVESRDHPASWVLRRTAVPSGNDLDLASGVVIAASGADIPSRSSATLVQGWSPPTSGDHLVILEVTAGGEKYYDLTLLRR